MTNKLKAVIFDIDNTLTNDISWLRVTEILGASVSEHEAIFAKFLVNELPYKEAKRQLVRLWQATAGGSDNQALVEPALARSAPSSESRLTQRP